MQPWDVSKLIGAEVWLKLVKCGEHRGTIEAVNKSFLSEDREEAVNLSLFTVKLNNGYVIESAGSTFSSIDSDVYPLD